VAGGSAFADVGTGACAAARGLLLFALRADGLGASTRENVLTKEGVETSVALSADKSAAVNCSQGVVKIPEGFEKVKTLEFAPGEVTFVSTKGNRVSAPVRHEFLKTGKL
jgi:hypothetical protein